MLLGHRAGTSAVTECEQASHVDSRSTPITCPTVLVLIRSSVAVMRAVHGADPYADAHGHAEWYALARRIPDARWVRAHNKDRY